MEISTSHLPAFLIDECQNILLSGWGSDILTASNVPGSLTSMPVTANAAFPNPINGYDFYLMALSRDADSLIYGSYYGGGNSREHVDGGTSRFDKKGIIYQSVCAGCVEMMISQVLLVHGAPLMRTPTTTIVTTESSKWISTFSL